MADYNNLLARAQLIKNETETSANTAERVGQLLEDIINAMAAGDNDRKTIRQVYDAQQRLQVLFEVNGQCVIRYSATVNGRSWSDELYYASTQYPNEGTFYTLTRRDFIESRFDGTPRGVCIAPKTVAAAPAIEYTFEVVYLRGSITWHNGDLFRTPSTNDIQCAKLSTTEDVSAAINLSTSAQGYIYTDQSELVEALADNTLYTMNASASGGAFTIPARSDYSGTSIFCYGDGVATLNGTNYAYTSGQTLLLVGGVVHVEDNVADYYTREETDEQLDEIRESLSTVYKYKGSCTFANLPTTNRKVGDTYNVTNAFTLDGVTYPAGTNVSWTGTEWGALAGDSSNKEDKGNKVTSLSASSTDTQYPSAKCVYDALTGKADDNGVVHNTGDETIAGVKSFTSTMKFGSGSVAIDLVKNGSAMELQKASIFRLQRVYTNTERHIAINVYGSTDGEGAYPRVVAQKKNNSSATPTTTETTSVALRDDRVSFASNRTTEWGFVNATSNSDSNWATKEVPTKNAVKTLVDSHLTDIVITLD